MDHGRFVITPYYELLDTVIQPTLLKITNNYSSDKSGRFIGQQIVEFSLRFDHGIILAESKKQKSTNFSIRAIIRFCRSDEAQKYDNQISLKDNFPIHLRLELNNNAVTLPPFLPNDRTGKDGRRYPKPVDLSDGLLDNPLVMNRLNITWIQDDSVKDVYFFGIYLVRLRTNDELTSLLLKKQLSPIQKTLNFILEQNSNMKNNIDDDIMLMDSTVNTSLICPVSRVRMQTPVRGQSCTHLQCFDCVTYLIINFKKPTWQCPVCDKKTFFCYLEVDGLISSILSDDRSKTAEIIVFNKQGQWKPNVKKLCGIQDEKVEAFYNIKELLNPDEASTSEDSHTVNINSTPSTEITIEKCLNHILRNPDAMSLVNKFSTPGITNIHYCNLSQSSKSVSFPSNANSHIFHTSPACSKTTSAIPAQNKSYCLSHFEQTNQSNFVQDLHKKNSEVLFALSGHSNNNKLPNGHCNSTITHMCSQPKITSVSSVDRNLSKVPEIIVISDDENDMTDVQIIRSVPKKVTNKCQKRPTAVSSVPGLLESTKIQKLSEKSNQRRSQSANVSNQNEMPSYDCGCTSNNWCHVHREYFINAHPLYPAQTKLNNIGIKPFGDNIRPTVNPSVLDSRSKCNNSIRDSIAHSSYPIIPTNIPPFNNISDLIPNTAGLIQPTDNGKTPQMGASTSHIVRPIAVNNPGVMPLVNDELPYNLLSSSICQFPQQMQTSSECFSPYWTNSSSYSSHFQFPSNLSNIQAPQFNQSIPILSNGVNSYFNSSAAFLN